MKSLLDKLFRRNGPPEHPTVTPEMIYTARIQQDQLRRLRWTELRKQEAIDVAEARERDER